MRLLSHCRRQSQIHCQPLAQVRELTDQEGFVEHCAGAAAEEELELAEVKPKQLCFLLFVPDILDSQAIGRNKYLEVSDSFREQTCGTPFVRHILETRAVFLCSLCQEAPCPALFSK